ncbi:hypothetical protein KFL_004190090 [Klebsormidium nitens]|uniref:Uncharacterized protein n=1 Tax=Klebsormidium nitens TaxID=105231 RepID=A0A1Y1IJM3_KLENI|nr:hypothetical protein KFL_004190090 [Klebsormidium nitens]|eukprot:GAQ88338.1 hypothetical protein KFL_004190090 [Klebsormidium nitens]
MSAHAATAACRCISHAFFVSPSCNAGSHRWSTNCQLSVRRSQHCPRWRQLNVTPASVGSWQGSLQLSEIRRGENRGPLRLREGKCVLVRGSVDVRGAADAPVDIASDQFREAAKSGDLRLCKELLASGGIDVNQPNPDKGGWTALQLSVFYQHPEVAEFLLDNGAEIDGRNASGNTALQFACIKSDVRLANLLIDRGADVFAMSNDKGTAIDYAEEWGGEEIVNFIHLKATQQSQEGAS